jgi:hypothetical protein
MHIYPHPLLLASLSPPHFHFQLSKLQKSTINPFLTQISPNQFQNTPWVGPLPSSLLLSPPKSPPSSWWTNIRIFQKEQKRTGSELYSGPWIQISLTGSRTPITRALPLWQAEIMTVRPSKTWLIPNCFLSEFIFWR